MKLYPFEVTNGFNWGKFAVGDMSEERVWASGIAEPNSYGLVPALLTAIGWNHQSLWVLDLQTCEGAAFRPGGLAAADLDKHKIWVCPMFEPFLTWLYTQDTSDLGQLPRVVNLADAESAMYGYRRGGPR